MIESRREGGKKCSKRRRKRRSEEKIEPHHNNLTTTRRTKPYWRNDATSPTTSSQQEQSHIGETMQPHQQPHQQIHHDRTNKTLLAKRCNPINNLINNLITTGRTKLYWRNDATSSTFPSQQEQSHIGETMLAVFKAARPEH